MRHRARLNIPFNAVTELASFVADPTARRRNIFERTADGFSKEKDPTLGVGDWVMMVRSRNKFGVTGDIYQV